MAGGTSAVVVGAGIGGLAAALALSRAGFEVVVIERDDTPMPDDVEGAFEWDRRGAPQVRHTHGFPALIRVMLRDRYPVADIMAGIDVPAVVVYGGADTIVPPEQSLRVAEAAVGPVEVVRVDGADHNDRELAEGPALIHAVTALADRLVERSP